jgi:alanine racemase
MPRAWAEVDVSAFRANVREVRRITGRPVLAVVKANGYGHGAALVARAAVEAGAAMLGVATPVEALELRESAVTAPILVLQPLLDDEVDVALGASAACVVSTEAELARVARAARRLSVRARVHVKADSGLARNGAPPARALALLAAAASDPSVELDGLMTHLACALDPETTREQLATFGEVVARARAAGLAPRVHAAASAAAILHPDARFDLVRPGLALYGVDDGGAFARAGARLAPVLSLRARVLRVREIDEGTPVGYGATWSAKRRTRLAVVGIGYDDGIRPRQAQGGALLIAGRRCPLVATVMMDSVIVDASDVPVAEGDVATAIGQDGAERISVEEIARLDSVIPYVVTCGLGRRVARVAREPLAESGRATLERSGRDRSIAAA